ncbi:MAG: zinc-ribbon domain-containing protein [Actinobacteria bacterium]|nr:MAG: zinc-ribbon domain-containing protein [Actinomycetota bacterium]
MLTCPNCGRENPEDFKFCAECGTALGAEAVQARELRKLVTVVFADITGSTALGEQVDPELLRRVLERYFEEMRRILEHHGGTVEKFIGDAIMAVFGRWSQATRAEATGSSPETLSTWPSAWRGAPPRARFSSPKRHHASRGMRSR